MSSHSVFRGSPRRQQRGVVLLFCLVVLVVLLAGGVAVMRSMNASLTTAGNLAFRRDLVNKGEQATAKVLTQFRSGVLQTPASDAADLKSANYSASRLDTNAQGIPTVLLQDDTAFAAKGTAIDLLPDADGVIKVRYIIDRLCNAAGLPSTLGPTGCVYAPSTTQVTGGSSQRARDDLPPPSSIVYRLSIRVTGPRDTQVFLQSSFTKPEL